jgi:amino acid permease
MMFPVWTIAEERFLALNGGADSEEYEAAKIDEQESFDDENEQDEASHVHHAPSPQAWKKRLLRASVVVTTALVAYAVPDFGEYLSLVGSSICTILGFLLPAYFHLQVYGSELKIAEQALNWFLLVGGSIFALVGTIQSFMHMAFGVEGGVRRS